MLQKLPSVLLNGTSSGSNYLLELLAETFRGNKNVRVSPSPKETHLSLQKSLITSIHLTLQTGTTLHPWSEYDYLFKNTSESVRMVFLYRDPRDIAITWFNYWRSTLGCTSFIDCITKGIPAHKVPSFYILVNDLKFFYNSVFYYCHRLSYEQLAFQSREALVKLIDFMSYPIDINAADNSLKAVKRTGKIGQWVQFFSNNEVAGNLQGGSR